MGGGRRIIFALFLAGFASLSLLWGVQPLLPALARAFGLTPATSALAISACTAPLVPALFLMSALSETVGRKRLMIISLLAAASLHLAGGLAANWWVLVALRAGEGVALGGAPAVAMAYLSEELPSPHVPSAMGIYVSGTVVGGLFGRVASGALAEFFGWSGAMVGIGGVSLVSGVAFALLLPPSRRFRPRRAGPRFHLAAWKRHLVDPRLLPLFIVVGLAMGAFVSTFNYVGFLLSDPPSSLDERWIGSLYLVFALGVAASSSAGRLVGRWGRRAVLLGGQSMMAAGLLVTLSASLTGVVAGVSLLTVGFFATHAVASGGVGQVARGAKGHASALYLGAYYLGASAFGWAGGLAWHALGWTGCVGFALALLAVGVLCARPLEDEPATA